MRNQGQRAAEFLVQKRGGPFGWGGLQVQGPRRDQHSWGGEPYGLSLERVVHVQLGMRTSNKVLCGPRAHSASRSES